MPGFEVDEHGTEQLFDSLDPATEEERLLAAYRLDNETLRQIGTELAAARHKFPDLNSLHEAYAVLLEEVDELWAEIKKKDCNIGRVEAEAIQVAAMAVRLINDCCTIGRAH